MKIKLLFMACGALLFLLLLTSAVQAQGEPPAPYAALVNPFPWGDPSAQGAGKGIYQRSCLGCHGIKGDNVAVSDFSAGDYPSRLEKAPAFYFWVLSEGRMDKGMPPFKSALSEEERWQVLTYIWSLGAPPATSLLAAGSPSEKIGGSLRLTVPQMAQVGKPLSLEATLQDDQGKPIAGHTVKFFFKVDFFTSGLMEIGEAMTDGQGKAVLVYSPRLAGEMAVVARSGGKETVSTLTLTENPEVRYQAEAGLKLRGLGPDVLIGPRMALELGGLSPAPATAFRLPAGFLSWLLLLIGIVALIWFTYFRVIYQVFRIPIVREIRDIDTRLVPLVGLGIVLFLGVLLVTMLLTGPYTHLHLPR